MRSLLRNDHNKVKFQNLFSKESHLVAIIHLILGTAIQFGVQWGGLESVILFPLIYGPFLYAITLLAVESFKREIARTPAVFLALWFLGAIWQVIIRFDELPYDAYSRGLLRTGLLPTHDYLINMLTPTVAVILLVCFETGLRFIFDYLSDATGGTV